MQVHNEFVIPLSDLATVTIECGDCHALLTVNLASPHDVTRCGACNREFEQGLKSAVNRLANIYVQTAELRQKIYFRVPAPPLR